MRSLLGAAFLGVLVCSAGAQPQRYVAAPVKRQIGFDLKRPNPATIIAEGVDAALTQAAAGGTKFAVFEIDGGAGAASEALLVADAILRHNETMETIAVIRECRGPSLFIALACERWFVLPKGRRAAISIELEGDEAALVDELARIAEAGGRSRELALALGDATRTLYASAEGDAPATFSAQATGEPLDDSTSDRLELTGDQLIELGLAERGARTRDLWEHLGLDEAWERDGKPNQAIGPDTVRGFVKDHKAIKSEIDDLFDAIEKTDRAARDAQAYFNRVKRTAPVIAISRANLVDVRGKVVKTWGERLQGVRGQITEGRRMWAEAVNTLRTASRWIGDAPGAAERFDELSVPRPFERYAASERARFENDAETLAEWIEVLEPLLSEAEAEHARYDEMYQEMLKPVPPRAP